jgi:isocitrate dehydrogenase (NAD+)
LIPGDGIGPEVAEAARRAVAATGVDIDWDVEEIGRRAFERTGEALPSRALASIRDNGVALKGPIETPSEAGIRSANIALRKELDLFANVRPCRCYPGVPSLYDDVDLLVVRENTEDV